MTAKTYLRRIAETKWHIQAIEREIRHLRAVYNPLPSPRLDSERVQSTPDASRHPADTWLALEQELENEKLNLINMYRATINEIADVHDDTQQRILEARYIEGASLGQIAQQLGYSYDYTKHMHLDALRAFEEAHPDKLNVE